MSIGSSCDAQNASDDADQVHANQDSLPTPSFSDLCADHNAQDLCDDWKRVELGEVGGCEAILLLVFEPGSKLRLERCIRLAMVSKSSAVYDVARPPTSHSLCRADYARLESEGEHAQRKYESRPYEVGRNVFRDLRIVFGQV